MIGKLYILEEGYMTLMSDSLNICFMVPKKLTKINSITSQEGGYIVLDTNYGEEYIDLESILGEIELDMDLCQLNVQIGGQE